MAFTSFKFLIFVVICVAAYYVCPKKARWVVLLVASYAFYLLSSAKTFVFLLAATVITFFGGKVLGSINTQTKKAIEDAGSAMDRAAKKELKAQAKKKMRKVVAGILILDFGMLAVLKYFSVYLAALGDVIGVHFELGLLIPLGISFYTFQSAAYIFDLYRGKYDADTNIAKFALFLSFFPQIIQGPIARYDHLAHQLYEGHAFKYQNLAHGVQLILWGFFKKLVIADRCAVLVDNVFDMPGEYAGWAVALAALFYTVQIYGDFSGGIDIARGVARCMGIDMSHNFKRPYFADSLSEFWRRWHMSLSFWTRDYIFFPIAMSKAFGKAGKSLRKVLGDRVGKLFPVICAQLATFIIIGLWHGADFKYVAYGLYNGFIIILSLLMEPYFKAWAQKLHINTAGFAWKVFGIVRTVILVSFGRIFTKAASFGTALSMMGSIFAIHNYDGFVATVHSFELSMYDYFVLIVACAFWFVVSLLQERQENKAKEDAPQKKGIVQGKAQGEGDAETGAEFRLLVDKLPLPVRWVIYLAGFAAVLGFGVYGPGYDAATFIYRGF